MRVKDGVKGVGRGLDFGQVLVKVGKDPVKTQALLLRNMAGNPLFKRELSPGTSVRVGEGRSLVENAPSHRGASRLCAGEGLPYGRLP